MKRINWKRISSIEYSVKQILFANPRMANLAYAKNMLFLLETIHILWVQTETFKQEIKKKAAH